MEQIFVNMDPTFILSIIGHYAVVLAIMAAAFTIHWLPVKTKEGIEFTFVNMSLVSQAVIVAIISMLVYQSVTSDVLPFIYFQF
jgi:hypothetical protein